MDDILDYFLCDACAGKDFKLVYNFCVRFHGVNFSDDLIYDKTVGERFQCTKLPKNVFQRRNRIGINPVKKGAD